VFKASTFMRCVVPRVRNLQTLGSKDNPFLTAPAIGSDPQSAGDLSNARSLLYDVEVGSTLLFSGLQTPPPLRVLFLRATRVFVSRVARGPGVSAAGR